jgi:uncharacterized protein (TIGR03118 family)
MSEPLRGVLRAPRPRWLVAAAIVGAAVASVLLPTMRAQAHDQNTANSYRQTNLVSDISGVARLTDPNLVNPWGVAAGPSTPLWVSDEGTSKATLYTGGFDHMPPAIAPLVVTIPGGSPTGQVFNSTSGFAIGSGPTAAPARFIFDSLTGNIVAWNPTAGAVIQASTPGAGYTGLAIATGKHGSLLYAANFATGKIDVFGEDFKPVTLKGGFVDANLPDDYAPFNIQEIGGRLYVAYALRGEDGDEEVGPGNGFVDVFTKRGHLVRRLISGGALNAPWGLVRAPESFGAFGGSLLVGNFGDGTINAYDPRTGDFQGALEYSDGSTVSISGLWALRFGNGVAGSPDTLLFTAGIGDEEHGLFGSIEPEG